MFRQERNSTKVLQEKFFRPALEGKGGEPAIIRNSPPLAIAP